MQGVDAYGFPRAGRAGDEQVRHAGEVEHDPLAADVLADGEQQRTHVRKMVADQNVAEGDGRAAFVRDLDADEGLAGDGGEYTNGRRGQGQREVVGERGDAIDLDPLGDLDLEQRDCRPGHPGLDPRRDVEGGEGLLDELGGAPKLLVARARARRRLGAGLQKRERREFEAIELAGRDGTWSRYCAPFGLGVASGLGQRGLLGRGGLSGHVEVSQG
jgi:hypothetical protein